MGKLKIVIAVIVLLVCLNFLKNGIVQGILSGSLSKAANVPVKIGSTRFSFLASSIHLRNIRVQNPSSFPEKLMLDAPEVAIDFEPRDLFKGQAHFEEVRMNLKEIIVIKDKAGKLNIDAVKPSQSQREKEKQKAAKPEKAAKGRAPKLMIDKLSLTIGRVVYKDFSGGGEPRVEVFNVNIRDRVYTKIDNPSAVISLIMFEALTKTSLSRLAELDIKVFREGALGALSGGLGLVSDGTENFEKAAKGVLSLFEN